MSFVLGVEDLQPDSHRVPEKIEHAEKGGSEYNVNTVTMTGNQHTKVDDDIHVRPPPWPPRPGRRSFISIKARNSIPTIWRPGRAVKDSISSKAKRKSSPQVFRPNILRPGRDAIGDSHPIIFRPGREDVPKRPPILFRPGREDVPQLSSVFKPGRDKVPSKPQQPFVLRPGREDVPQLTLLRPGREFARQSVYLFRPGRDNVPDPFQHSVVRAGRRNIRYNMPWTYVGSSVNSHVHQKSHTFHQKAQEELAKRELPQEMSDPSNHQGLRDF